MSIRSKTIMKSNRNLPNNKGYERIKLHIWYITAKVINEIVISCSVQNDRFQLGHVTIIHMTQLAGTQCFPVEKTRMVASISS